MGIFCPGHVEKRFSITSDDWKQIQVHVDSKCRSAYRCKSRGVMQTVRALRRRAAEQTPTSCIRTGLAETYSSDAADLQPQIAEVDYAYCSAASLIAEAIFSPFVQLLH